MEADGIRVAGGRDRAGWAVESPVPGVRAGWDYVDVEAGDDQLRVWTPWTGTADGLAVQLTFPDRR